MKKIFVTLVVIALFATLVVKCVGVGYVYSGSAAADFVEDLESIYGKEYTGKEVEDGIQDMKFVIEPRTFFFTDWHIRQEFSMNYEYECFVIFTTYLPDGKTRIHTISYDGIDPMGREHRDDRAYIDLSSISEKEEIND